MIKIIVKINSRDEMIQSICEDYWKLDDEGKFFYKVSEIAEKNDLRASDITKLVKDNCFAYYDGNLCPKCQEPLRPFTARSDYNFSLKCYGQSWLCNKCTAQKEQEERDAIVREKLEKMYNALDSGIIESLNNLEFNFLVGLAISNEFEMTRKKMGLSNKNATSLLEKFNELNIVNWGIGIEGYYILPELVDVLKNIGFKNSVKSIFGSPKALNLYRHLKRNLQFVYPEIPLCVFIDVADVEHLFTELWHREYFLRCRADFVICDREGIPEYVIEYHGGYHSDNRQKIKDEFKKVILNEVGIEMKVISNRDITELDL